MHPRLRRSFHRIPPAQRRTSHEPRGGSSSSRRDIGNASHIPNTSFLASSTVLDIAHYGKLSVRVWMLDSLAWTHYWQRPSKATFLLAPCQCTHHTMSNGRQSPISSLHTSMPRAYLDFYASMSSFSGSRLGLKPEAGGKAALGCSIPYSTTTKD